MDDNKKIVIELKSIYSDESGEESGDSAESETETAQDRFDQYRKKAVKSAATKMVSWGISEATQAISYNVNNYLNLAEDYKTSTAIANINTSVNKVKKLASSTISGAMAGSSFGPVGTVIGAAVGAATDVLSETFDLIRQYQTQSLGLAMSDMQAQFSSSRLGLTDNGRGTEY